MRRHFLLFVCVLALGCNTAGPSGEDVPTDGGMDQRLPDDAYPRFTDVMEMPKNPFFHGAFLYDFNGDGILDVVTSMEYFQSGVGDAPESGEHLVWVKGVASPNRFEPTLYYIGPDLGAVINFYDVDADGDKDLVSAAFFNVEGKSFGWLEDKRTATTFEMEYHNINYTLGSSIMLQIVPGLFSGSEAVYALGTNHVNTLFDPEAPESGFFAFEIPADPTQQWPVHQLSTELIQSDDGSDYGDLAPGVFDHGDLDGDGDIDVIVSGDGDPRVFLFEQTEPGAFAQHVLEEDQPQTGGLKIVDLDGDEVPEAVLPGFEKSTLNIYTHLHGAAPFYAERILVDDDPTKGPAFVTIADMNTDGRLDIVCSNYGSSPAYMSGVSVYFQGETLNDWTEAVALPLGRVTFATQTDVGDIDGDGDLDILLPTGFLACFYIGKAPCGGLIWLENQDQGQTWQAHEIWKAEA